MHTIVHRMDEAPTTAAASPDKPRSVTTMPDLNRASPTSRAPLRQRPPAPDAPKSQSRQRVARRIYEQNAAQPVCRAARSRPAPHPDRPHPLPLSPATMTYPSRQSLRACTQPDPRIRTLSAASVRAAPPTATQRGSSVLLTTVAARTRDSL